MRKYPKVWLDLLRKRETLTIMEQQAGVELRQAHRAS